MSKNPAKLLLQLDERELSLAEYFLNSEDEGSKKVVWHPDKALLILKSAGILQQKLEQNQHSKHYNMYWKDIFISLEKKLNEPLKAP